MTLTSADINEIQELIRTRMSHRIIALKFDVDVEVIRGISARLKAAVQSSVA